MVRVTVEPKVVETLAVVALRACVLRFALVWWLVGTGMVELSNHGSVRPWVACEGRC